MLLYFDLLVDKNYLNFEELLAGHVDLNLASQIGAEEESDRAPLVGSETHQEGRILMPLSDSLCQYHA